MDTTNSKKELMNLLKKNKGNLITLCIFAGITAILVAVGVILQFRAMPDPIGYRNSTKLDEYVECEVEDLTDYFAEYTYDGKVQSRYYLILADSGLGVVEFSDDKYEEVSKIVENNEIAYITGMTREMSYDLKKLTIESYNEMMESDFLNYSNFEDYVVPYVINTKENPNSDSQVAYGFAFIFGIISLFCGIVYASQYLGSKSNLKKYEKEMDLNMVVEEMKQSKLYSKITRVIITDNYIISYSNRVIVIKISDIVWMYPHNTRTNGAKTQQCVMIMDKNRKLISIANTGVSKKKNQEFEETYVALMNVKEKMLRGYTGDNMVATKKENFEETLKNLEIM